MVKGHSPIKRNLNATVAKLHAIYGKRLRDADYSSLLSCSSVAEAVGYLRANTYYQSVLESINPDNVHRGNFETILHRGRYENYFHILNFERIGNEEFYNYLVIKTEIDEILICITHLNAKTTDHITTLPIYMNRYTSFNLMDLAHVRSFAELLALVEKSPYYDILKAYQPKMNDDGSEDRINATGCELSMRTYYYVRLLESAEAIGGESARKLKKLIGSEIDIINIINAYRMKKYFNADGADIKKRMIPIYENIAERRLDELYSSQDEKEFITRLSSTYYGRAIAEQGYDMKKVEASLTKIRCKQTKRAFSRSTSTPECFYTFNKLADIEVRNIIRLVEGIRYSLPVKELSSLIIS